MIKNCGAIFLLRRISILISVGIFTFVGLPLVNASPRYTLHPKTPVVGPIQTRNIEAPYIDQIFELSVRQAHLFAKDFVEAGDYAGYWTMILGALVVPHHESHLEQFTATSSTRCETATNSGRNHKNHSRDLWNLFLRLFKKETLPVAPDCSQFAEKMNVTQLLGSGDVLSTGLFQVTMTHHRNFYFAGGHLNVLDTLLYGQRFYLNEMIKIYWGALDPKSSLYSLTQCIRLPETQSIDYQAVIRGTWSGPFNSGSYRNICRFTLPASQRGRWKDNDPNFKTHLDSILENSSRSLYRSGLSAPNQKYLSEILTKFKKEGNKGSEPSKEWLSLVQKSIPSEFSGNPFGRATPPDQWTRFRDTPIQSPVATTPSSNEGATGQISYLVKSEVPSTAPKTIRWVLTEALNVRTGPSPTAPVCGIVRGGSPVNVIATPDPKWSEIKIVKSTKFAPRADQNPNGLTEELRKDCLSAKSLYVFASHLSPERIGKFFKVTAKTGATLRSTPGTANITGTLNFGELVWVTEYRKIHNDANHVWYFSTKHQAWIFSDQIMEHKL